CDCMDIVGRRHRRYNVRRCRLLNRVPRPGAVAVPAVPRSDHAVSSRVVSSRPGVGKKGATNTALDAADAVLRDNKLIWGIRAPTSGSIFLQPVTYVTGIGGPSRVRCTCSETWDSRASLRL